MKRLLIVTLCTIVAGVMSAGCTKKDLIAQKNREIADLDADVQRLQGEVDRLENEVTTQKEMNSELEKTLSDLREEQEVWVRQREGLTHITLDGSANFPSARAVLTDDAKRVIDRLGAVLENYPDRWILIEGHADSRPIASDYQWKYSSNWELSTARANSVLHYLVGKYDIQPERIKAVGLGEFHPAEEGSSPEAFAKNRRVEITVGSEMNIQKLMASRNQ